MYLSEIAALSAAACWSFASLLAAGPVERLGSIAFNRIRMAVVALMLVLYTSLIGTWDTIEQGHAMAILLSALTGIVLGDTALFVTMRRLGPRRTGILFATNAPMATFLGWAVLGEHLGWFELIGTLLVIIGVMFAIFFGKKPSQVHKWEAVKGSIFVGVAWGLLAASGQAIGSLIIKPALLDGADPVAASAIRVAISAVCLWAISWLPIAVVKPKGQLDWNVFLQILFGGLIAMGVGMTLLLYAFAHGEIGIAASLSATAPVMMLPILWIKTKEPPAAGAWVGAALVVLGTALIFSV